MATAAAQLNEILTTTFDKVKPVLSDNITTSNALLAALNSKSSVTVDGGATIRRPIMYALNDTVGSYSDYDLLDTTPQDGFGYAEYTWKQYAGTVTVSGRDELLNAGSSRIIGLLQAKIEQLRLSFEESLNSMLWNNGSTSATGNSGKDFLSVTHIVGDGTNVGHNTLGGIDVDDQSWWVSGYHSGADLTTLDGIRTMNTVRNARALAKSKPDFIFADQDIYEAYEALAAPNIRFTDVKLADLGFDNVAFHNAQVMFEAEVPANSIYFINSNHLEFVKHASRWLERGPFQEPVNQDAKTMKVLSAGELLTDCRRAHAVMVNVVSS